MKKGVNWKYSCISLGVFLITTVLFVADYRGISALFSGITPVHICIIAITALIVHSIKAFRMYLALYGSGVNLRRFLKTYCKAAPVSIVFPYKLGELYRIYCYGVLLNDAPKGIVITLLDRFMDTIALVTIILLMWMFYGVHIASIATVLTVFLIFILLIYIVFPGVYQFWKRYMLKAAATKKRLTALGLLESCNNVFLEITGVTQGRGIILYFLSLIAWGIEIGSVALRVTLLKDETPGKVISEYLQSTLSTIQSNPLKLFIFMSVILSITVYMIIKLFELLPKEASQ